MIVKDTSIYLDYVRGIETKVNNLCDSIAAIPISDMHKQSIEKQRMQIFAKIALLAHKAKCEIGFIPHFQWIQLQQEINDLYTQLSNSVNQYITCYTTYNNVRE